MQAAAALVLEKEMKRKERAKARARRQRRKREKEQLAAVQSMQESLILMKRCIVGILTIMLVGIVLAIWFLSAVHTEVEKVQPKIENIVDEVTGVVDEVKRVQDSLRNPMQSIGGAFGRELDQKLQNLMGMEPIE